MIETASVEKTQLKSIKTILEMPPYKRSASDIKLIKERLQDMLSSYGLKDEVLNHLSRNAMTQSFVDGETVFNGYEINSNTDRLCILVYIILVSST